MIYGMVAPFVER